MSKFLILFLPLLLMACEKPLDNSPLREYELPTDEVAAKQKCKDLFKKFHGKFETHKHYGVVSKTSSINFYKAPDCAMACATTTFYWECSFNTNDEERGWMDFTSRTFQDYR